MSLFGTNKRAAAGKGERKVVVTGKRVSGTWTMESKISPKARQSESNRGVLVAENRRVRTLH